MKIQAKDEFKVGKNNIGWINDWVKTYVQDKELKEVAVPTFWKLDKTTKDSEILADERTRESTLDDVYAFLKNPPEGTKDGYSNLFYIAGTDRVVLVDWSGVEWGVSGWNREDAWYEGDRVFSPATDGASKFAAGYSSLDSLTLSLDRMSKTDQKLAAIVVDALRNDEPSKLRKIAELFRNRAATLDVLKQIVN